MNKNLVNTLWVVLVVLICAGLIYFLRAPNPAAACEIFKDGKFKYLSGTPEDPSAYFILKGDSVIEWNEYGEQYTKSLIERLDPCTFDLRTVATSYADYELKPEERVRCQISNVRKDTFHLSMTGKYRTIHFEILRTE